LEIVVAIASTIRFVELIALVFRELIPFFANRAHRIGMSV